MWAIMFKKIRNIVLILVIIFSFSFSFAVGGFGNNNVNVLIFSRDDCAHCQAEKAFFEKTNIEGINIIDFDITTQDGADKFDQITKKFNLAKVTPINLIGDSVLVGFSGGQDILEKIKIAKEKGKFDLNIEYYLKDGKKTVKEGGGVCDDENVTECKIEDVNLSTSDSKIEVVTKDEVNFLGTSINF